MLVADHFWSVYSHLGYISLGLAKTELVGLQLLYGKLNYFETIDCYNSLLIYIYLQPFPLHVSLFSTLIPEKHFEIPTLAILFHDFPLL